MRHQSGKRLTFSFTSLIIVGVDGSERMASIAQQNCVANRLDSSAGGPITIKSGRVEDLQVSTDQKVISKNYILL